MEPPIDVVVPGRPTLDVVFSRLDAWPRPGHEVYADGLVLSAGAHFNTAAALRRLELSVAFVAVVGDDTAGELIRRDVAAERLPEEHVRVLPTVPTPVSVALNEVGDRGFVTYGPEHEQAERAFVAETEHLLRSHAVRHVHADLSAARFLCETAHERGATLSAEAYDAGAWLASPEVHDLLTRVDLVFVNEHEALAMAGAQSLERAAAELAARCAHVVVKRGAEGAIAHVHGQAVHAAVTPVDVVDATGAGDCFAAGYLWGFLGGRSPADCLALGNVCGRGAVATLGGYQGAPTLAELLPTARAAGVALA